ncbi:hypothetical protein ACE1SV_16410 [Streptomyces sp. E-15]
MGALTDLRVAGAGRTLSEAGHGRAGAGRAPPPSRPGIGRIRAEPRASGARAPEDRTDYHGCTPSVPPGRRGARKLTG